MLLVSEGIGDGRKGNMRLLDNGCKSLCFRVKHNHHGCETSNGLSNNWSAPSLFSKGSTLLYMQMVNRVNTDK